MAETKRCVKCDRLLERVELTGDDDERCWRCADPGELSAARAVAVMSGNGRAPHDLGWVEVQRDDELGAFETDEDAGRFVSPFACWWDRDGERFRLLDDSGIADGAVVAPTDDADAYLAPLTTCGVEHGLGKRVQVCRECGCASCQITAWIDVNTSELVDSEPPLDRCIWCPHCRNDRAELVTVAEFLREATRG